MANFAVIQHDRVANVIDAPDLETAEIVTGLPCVEFTEVNPLYYGDPLDAVALKKLNAAKTKREADAKAAADKAEAARVKSIELELERARQAEAERLAAEEAAKPKPVTGIFVKVEKN